MTTRSDARMTQENPTATVKDTVLPLVTEGLVNQGLFVNLFISRRKQKMQMLRLHFSSQSLMTVINSNRTRLSAYVKKETNPSFIYASQSLFYSPERDAKIEMARSIEFTN